MEPCEYCHRGRQGHQMHAEPTVFLDVPAGVVSAVKDLCDAILFFHCRFLEEFGPEMLAEDAIIVGIVSLDFDDDHAARLSPCDQ